MDPTLTLVALALLALLWLYGALAVALGLLRWAWGLGPLWVAAYVAGWIFLLPVMAGACLVLGAAYAAGLALRPLLALGRRVGQFTERVDRGELRPWARLSRGRRLRF